VRAEHLFAYNTSHAALDFASSVRCARAAGSPVDAALGQDDGVLVRAETEAEARRLAQTKAGNEGRGIYSRFGLAEDEIAEDVWLTPEWTSCDELTSTGEKGVILVVRHGD